MSGERALVRATEVALGAITVATVLGMSRLFAGSRWVAPLLISAITAHVLAAVLRRRAVPLALAGGLMVIGAGLVVSWTSYWSTTVAGIPTADTVTAIRTDVSSAWGLYQHVVAPAPVSTGFLVISCLAIWAIAFVADWAAFRLWVPFEATLPAGTLFLFTALLGAAAGRAWGVAIYATAMLGFLLLHRLARQEGSSHWVAERRSAGNRSLLIAGAGLAAIAVLAGALIGPALPGADSSGILNAHQLNKGNQARVTISPLVDIRSRLVDNSKVEVFTVRSNARSYWRLTSLERFDGRIWSSSGSYGKAGSHLPEAQSIKVGTQEVDQTYKIAALSAIWLPSAYEARSFQGKGIDVRFDESSSTLIVDSSVATSDGLSYSVTSTSPRVTPADLTGTSGQVPASIRRTYTQLPAGFSPPVRQLAIEKTSTAATPYAQALALQDYLRTFTYDLTVPPGHSGSDLERFLFTTRRGYCEQFAGAFAAMARSIGLPARVAVGFTPGEPDPKDPTLYHVLGEHAHAWPEVYIAGAGWVAFEPTPGRGMPGAQSYTGVPESQAAAGSSSTATTLVPSAQVPGGTTGTVPQPAGGSASAGQKGTGTAGGGGSLVTRFATRPAKRALPFLVGAILLYAIVVPAALAAHRRRRRQRAGTPRQRIALAWVEATEDAAMVGFRERASDTYAEQADGMSEALPAAAVQAHALASARESAEFSPAGAADREVRAATTAATEIGKEARAAATRGVVARRWLDPRPPLQAWRRARSRNQRQITTVATGDLESERELVAAGDPS